MAVEIKLALVAQTHQSSLKLYKVFLHFVMNSTFLFRCLHGCVFPPLMVEGWKKDQDANFCRCVSETRVIVCLQILIHSTAKKKRKRQTCNVCCYGSLSNATTSPAPKFYFPLGFTIIFPIAAARKKNKNAPLMLFMQKQILHQVFITVMKTA